MCWEKKSWLIIFDIVSESHENQVMRSNYRSLETRNSSRSLLSSSRCTTQSAGTRQLQKSEVVTPAKYVFSRIL